MITSIQYFLQIRLPKLKNRILYWLGIKKTIRMPFYIAVFEPTGPNNEPLFGMRLTTHTKEFKTQTEAEDWLFDEVRPLLLKWNQNGFLYLNNDQFQGVGKKLKL